MGYLDLVTLWCLKSAVLVVSRVVVRLWIGLGLVPMALTMIMNSSIEKTA